MSRKILAEEAEKLVKDRWPYLSLKLETFTAVNNTCVLVDADFGEFETSVKNLLSGRSRPGHRKRFEKQIKEAGALGGYKAHQTYCQKEGLTPEDSKKLAAQKRKERARKRIQKISEARRKFYEEQYGVSWKGATPESRSAASERAKKQRLHENTRTILREKTGYSTWAENPDSQEDRVRYFVGGRPYFELSDPVGWNRDAARFYVRLYGEEEFVRACAEYSGPRNLLEKSFLQSNPVRDFNKKILGYRPDFVLNEKIFVNVDGLFWHSEVNQKDKRYHFKMREKFEQQGIRIVQIREDEFRKKGKIVLSVLENLAGKSRKVYARQCTVEDMTAGESKKFFDENHLMGGRRIAGKKLVHNGETVCAMSCSVKNGTLKIERFATKSGVSVVGGLSRLIRRYIELCQVERVESWVDLRYGTGISLEKIGFEKIKEVLGWKWCTRSDTFNRLRCRANMDDRGLSERDYARELGWFKIYDAGQRLYRLDISKNPAEQQNR